MNQYLNWAKPYIEHRDTFKKEITNIELNEKELIVSKKNIKEIYLPIGNNKIEEYLSEDYSKYMSIWLICDNSDLMITQVVNLWDTLLTNNKFKIIFVDIKTGVKWLLNPTNHSKIIPRNSLKNSLNILKSNAS